jgi:hypothetical protein
MKNKLVFPLIVFVIAITFCGAAIACNEQSGTSLSASVSASTHYQIGYGWAIDKTVTPDMFNLNKTDTGTSQYTVSVTKDEGTKTAWIEGYVTVKNDGDVATQGLSIKVNLAKSGTVIASTDVDTSEYSVLAPGETHRYYYRMNIPAEDIHSGSNYKVTSDVTITNHSGHLGTPFGPSPCDTTNLPEPTLINDKIHVVDSNGESWTFNESGFKTYNRIFSYKGNPTDVYANTATIQETGQSADATVTVNWENDDPPNDPPVGDDPSNNTLNINAQILSPVANAIVVNSGDSANNNAAASVIKSSNINIQKQVHVKKVIKKHKKKKHR